MSESGIVKILQRMKISQIKRSLKANRKDIIEMDVMRIDERDNKIETC